VFGDAAGLADASVFVVALQQASAASVSGAAVRVVSAAASPATLRAPIAPDQAALMAALDSKLVVAEAASAAATADAANAGSGVSPSIIAGIVVGVLIVLLGVGYYTFKHLRARRHAAAAKCEAAALKQAAVARSDVKKRLARVVGDAAADAEAADIEAAAAVSLSAFLKANQAAGERLKRKEELREGPERNRRDKIVAKTGLPRWMHDHFHYGHDGRHAQ
jgi:SWI/SNF-related matrix-associated actin-dependent regulator 1 of chromatin subfamily A